MILPTAVNFPTRTTVFAYGLKGISVGYNIHSARTKVSFIRNFWDLFKEYKLKTRLSFQKKLFFRLFLVDPRLHIYRFLVKYTYKMLSSLVQQYLKTLIQQNISRSDTAHIFSSFHNFNNADLHKDFAYSIHIL